VESWIEQSVMPLLLLRYEDMVADPAGCLVRVAEFSGLAVDGHQIGDAVERASFPVLRRAEVERGFVERPASLSSFFREGRAGGWRSVLGADQVERLVRDHGEWMSRLGFLPQDGEPLAKRVFLGSLPPMRGSNLSHFRNYRCRTKP
jgi:hypothetical protein